MVTMLHYDGLLEPIVNASDNTADKKSQNAAYLRDHPFEDIDTDSLAKVEPISFNLYIRCFKEFTQFIYGC